jgi:hypothetical protein
VQWLELPGAGAGLLDRVRADAPEWLGAAYFAQVGRLTLGLIRPRYRGREVELRPRLGPPALRLRIAERRRGPDGVRLVLRVVGGVLAERAGERGSLAIELLPVDGRLIARLELDGYRPSVAGLPVLGAAYDCIQARTHALHGRRFLGWLATHWPLLARE